MKSLSYCNRVLTVIAVLLTLNLYLQLTDSPAGSAVAPATQAHAAQRAPDRGVGNAAQATLDELRQINAGLAALNGTLTDGTVRVKVDSMPASEGE